MAPTPSIKITKSTPFKGGSRLWSNRYHFLGGTPSGSGPWTTFSDAVVAAEKACLGDNVHIVEATGYAAGSDVPVFAKDYDVVGTSAASGTQPPLQDAALVRYSTDQRTSKNHPIYLFNYYHSPIIDESHASYDRLASAQQSEYLAYADSWISGFSDGTNTLHRSGPNGAAALGAFVEEYVTHRDFPYSRSA